MSAAAQTPSNAPPIVDFLDSSHAGVQAQGFGGINHRRTPIDRRDSEPHSRQNSAVAA
jgi:hypothetical protein